MLLLAGLLLIGAAMVEPARVPAEQRYLYVALPGQATHGAKFAVSGVSTPILIGAAALPECEPPKAVDPPSKAVSAPRTPTAATNQNRFTDISFLVDRP